MILGHSKGDDRISNMLDRTYFHIVPMFNVDGIQGAVPGDCNGSKYQGPRFDDKLSEEKVGSNCVVSEFLNFVN